MVQLRSCYFCGTTDAVTEYETLPDAARAGDASQRVALCDRCQTKLTTVMRPVVERLAELAADAEADEPTATAQTGEATAGADVEQTEVTFGDAPTRDATDETGPGVAVGVDHPGTDSTEVAVEEAAGSATRPDDAEDATDERDDQGAGDGTGTAAGAPDDDSGEREGGHDGSVRGAENEDAASADAGGRTDLDRVYHKVLRFLRNREFPISRAEAEAVAQSAYDLDARESAQVIQRAVDRGVLEERDGELHRA